MIGFSTLKSTATVLTLMLATGGAVTAGPASALSSAETASVATSEQEQKSQNAQRRWKLTFRDRFQGRKINTDNWVVYDQNQRDADNAIVRDGKLILRTKRSGSGWSAAGVGNSRARQMQYGKYVIRTRFDRGYGVRATALLWPTGGVWPPEVNFFEVAANDTHRRVNRLTNHYSSRNQMIHREYRRDFTRWHRVGVIWTPKMLKFTFDGKILRRIRGHVPERKMWLGMQTAVGGETAGPTKSTPRVVDFEVDWVKIYRYLGRR